MTDFRSKKWFRELDEGRKQDICRRLGVTPEALKKAGHIDDDGDLRIDLLRLHFPQPEFWSDELRIVNAHIDKLHNISDIGTMIDALCSIYESLHGKTKFKKYKDTLLNKVRAESTYKAVIYFVRELDEDDREDMHDYYAHQIITHTNIGLKDLSMV